VSNEANILPSDIVVAHAIINELTLKNHKLLEDNYKFHDKNQELQQRVDWFMRQLFGEKSEKINHDASPLPMEQLWLGGKAPEQTQVAAPGTTIKEHVRKRCGKQALVDNCGESGLRFDSTVPVEEIPCPPRLRLQDLSQRITKSSIPR